MLPESIGGYSAGSFVQFSTLLAGVQPLTDDEKGVNSSYRGQLMCANGEIKIAIIKDLEPKQLANEVMVAALANELGLPIPEAHLVLANPSVLSVGKGPEIPNYGRIVFGSVDANVPPLLQYYKGKENVDYLKGLLKKLTQWKDLGRLYGFDTWVANIDRHMGNLLFSGNNDVWLIDHGHCFSGPNWALSDLEADKEYRNKLKGWMTPYMETSQRQTASTDANSLQNKMINLDIENLGRENEVDLLIDTTEFESLVDFLKSRIEHMPKLAAAALGINLMV